MNNNRVSEITRTSLQIYQPVKLPRMLMDINYEAQRNSRHQSLVKQT